MPFSVHGVESGVERLSHISTAMAVHFLLLYKYIQMLFFFSNSKNDFLLRCFVQYFSATIQQTVDILHHKPIKPVTVYLDADIAILVFAKLLQDSNKTVQFIILYAVICPCMCVCVYMYAWSVGVCDENCTMRQKQGKCALKKWAV